MMKRYLSILCLAAVALMGLACSGNIDPEDDSVDKHGQSGVIDTTSLSTGYAKKMIAMQFTSVGCTYCPILAEAIKEVEADYPGEIIEQQVLR